MSAPAAAVARRRGERGMKTVLAFAARPLGWALLGIVLAVALAIGSVHPAPPSRAARIATLESVLKCPNCVDLSIRQSNTAAAANLRAEVVRLVDEGKTDAQIEAIATSQYGPSELLVPPASGLGVLAWAIPVGAIAGGGLVLAVFLVRRRRAGGGLEGPSEEDEALVRAALARPVADGGDDRSGR